MKLKRFEEGGSFTELGGSMDILGGAVKSIYGVKQLREANRGSEERRVGKECRSRWGPED